MKCINEGGRGCMSTIHLQGEWGAIKVGRLRMRIQNQTVSQHFFSQIMELTNFWDPSLGTGRGRPDNKRD